MTNAELTVLSLIAEHPRHGYKIEQVITERIMRIWPSVGRSSVYFLLKKLEREDLIKGELEETESGPARKVYRLTQKGLEAVRTAALLALSAHLPSPHPPLQLGLINLRSLSTAEALEALRGYLQSLKDRKGKLCTLRESKGPRSFYGEAAYDYSLTMLDAELEWVSGFISKLEAKSQLEPD